MSIFRKGFFDGHKRYKMWKVFVDGKPVSGLVDEVEARSIVVNYFMIDDDFNIDMVNYYNEVVIDMKEEM